MVTDPVLGVRGPVSAPESAGVGLVVAGERCGSRRGVHPPAAEERVRRPQAAAFDADLGAMLVVIPRPAVAEPEGGEEVEVGLVGTMVAHRHLDQDVLRARLRVVGDDLEVPAAVEDAGVDQLVFRFEPSPPRVLLDELFVGERALRVHVPPAHPGVRGSRVQVPPVLLGVLAVVAQLAVEPEDPLLEEGVHPVPEGEGEAEGLAIVADPAETVLVPPVGAGAGVVEGEGLPRIRVGAVVLAHRPPGALAHIRAPAPPGRAAARDLLKPLPFGGARGWLRAHRSRLSQRVPAGRSRTRAGTGGGGRSAPGSLSPPASTRWQPLPKEFRDEIFVTKCF